MAFAPDKLLRAAFGEDVLKRRDWDPEEHPRWPTRAPMGLGGQFLSMDQLAVVLTVGLRPGERPPSRVDLTFMARGAPHIDKVEVRKIPEREDKRPFEHRGVRYGITLKAGDEKAQIYLDDPEPNRAGGTHGFSNKLHALEEILANLNDGQMPREALRGQETFKLKVAGRHRQFREALAAERPQFNVGDHVHVEDFDPDFEVRGFQAGRILVGDIGGEGPALAFQPERVHLVARMPTAARDADAGRVRGDDLQVGQEVNFLDVDLGIVRDEFGEVIDLSVVDERYIDVQVKYPNGQTMRLRVRRDFSYAIRPRNAAPEDAPLGAPDTDMQLLERQELAGGQEAEISAMSVRPGDEILVDDLWVEVTRVDRPFEGDPNVKVHYVYPNGLARDINFAPERQVRARRRVEPIPFDQQRPQLEQDLRDQFGIEPDADLTDEQVRDMAKILNDYAEVAPPGVNLDNLYVDQLGRYILDVSDGRMGIAADLVRRGYDANAVANDDHGIIIHRVPAPQRPPGPRTEAMRAAINVLVDAEDGWSFRIALGAHWNTYQKRGADWVNVAGPNMGARHDTVEMVELAERNGQLEQAIQQIQGRRNEVDAPVRDAPRRVRPEDSGRAAQMDEARRILEGVNRPPNRMARRPGGGFNIYYEDNQDDAIWAAQHLRDVGYDAEVRPGGRVAVKEVPLAEQPAPAQVAVPEVPEAPPAPAGAPRHRRKLVSPRKALADKAKILLEVEAFEVAGIRRRPNGGVIVRLKDPGDMRERNALYGRARELFVERGYSAYRDWDARNMPILIVEDPDRVALPPADAGAAAPDLGDLTRLQGKVVHVKRLGGGINDTRIGDLESTDERVVIKPEEGLHGMGGGRDIDKEMAAYELSLEMKKDGLDIVVPGVAVNEGNVEGVRGRALVYEYVRGDTADRYGGNYHDLPGYHEMKIFDYLIANSDRHGGNFMIPDGERRIVAIDNGLSFHARDRFNPDPPRDASDADREFARKFLARKDEIDPQIARWLRENERGQFWERVQNLAQGGDPVEAERWRASLARREQRLAKAQEALRALRAQEIYLRAEFPEEFGNLLRRMITKVQKVEAQVNVARDNLRRAEGN